MRINYADIIPYGSGQDYADELASRFVAVRDGVNLSLQYRGAWSNATAYDVNDLVANSGKKWIALVASTNSTPVEGTDWTAFDNTSGVTGPASSVTNNIPAFGGTTGKALVDSGFKFDDLGAPRTITQNAHGFVAGDQVYLSGSNTYAKAKADALATTNPIGRVATVPNANTFVLSRSGYLTGLSGLTAGALYYLSPATAGAMTVTLPATAGHYVRPVFYADTTTSGYILDRPAIPADIVLKGAVTASGLTQSTAKLLGRATAATGAIEEIGLATGLVFSGGNLALSGVQLAKATITTTAQTIDGTKDITHVNSASPTTTTMPATVNNQTGEIVCRNISTGTATFTPNAGQAFEAGADKVISVQFGSFIAYLDGTVWRTY